MHVHLTAKIGGVMQDVVLEPVWSLSPSSGDTWVKHKMLHLCWDLIQSWSFLSSMRLSSSSAFSQQLNNYY